MSLLLKLTFLKNHIELPGIEKISTRTPYKIEINTDCSGSTPNCPSEKTKNPSLKPHPAMEIGKVVTKTIKGTNMKKAMGVIFTDMAELINKKTKIVIR